MSINTPFPVSRQYILALQETGIIELNNPTVNVRIQEQLAYALAAGKEGWGRWLLEVWLEQKPTHRSSLYHILEFEY